MIELSEILKNEAWLEGEKRNKPVCVSDLDVFIRSLEIWNKENERNNKYKETNIPFNMGEY